MKTGIELIAQERRDQIEKHHFTPENDDKFKKGELKQFADYIIFANENRRPTGFNQDCISQIFLKPRVQQLAIAGALIAAEIDRLIRIDNELER